MQRALCRERERNRSAKLQQELNYERKIRNELREALSETQRELAGLRAEQAGGRASLPTVAPPQVITFKTEREEQPNSKKLVLPPLTAKSESEMEELLVIKSSGPEFRLLLQVGVSL